MKKIFLSLSAIALLAVGTVSCGSDDSPAPEPAPGLTENFIEVDGEQEEILYTIYAVHVDGAGNDAPIKEYTLQDGTVVAAFEVISHNGTAAGSIGKVNTWSTFLTKVDTSIPADSEEGSRYSFPFTVEGGTLLGGFTTTFNGVNYEYAENANFDITDISFASGAQKISYNLTGVDATQSSVVLGTNLTDASMSGLFSINVAASSKNAIGVAKVDNTAKLSLRKGL